MANHDTMQIKIEHVPFARFGSYLTFSILPPFWGHPGLVLRTMHGWRSREAFRLVMTREGREVAYTVSATPTLCTLEPSDGEGGRLEICLPETDVARIRAVGVGLRLVSIPAGNGHYAFPTAGRSWHVNCQANGVQYYLIPLAGKLSVDAPLHRDTQKRGGKEKPEPAKRPPVIADFAPDASGLMECALHEFVMTPRTLTTLSLDFDKCHALALTDWAAWLRTKPSLPKQYSAAGDHAMQVNYAATVGPWGNYKRNVMLMSRNWMTQCWSWDHCFNAIACSYKNPDVAWDQLNVHFDLQEPGGCIPDGVTAEFAGWNFCKPPIHGWTLSKMAKVRGLFTKKRMEEFYPKLAKWTDWWFAARDNDGDGLPEYHNGNDSGWDNGTVFDVGFPLAGADLQAFLILQMDVLAQLAADLGKKQDAASWKMRADTLLERMIEKLWDGDQFRGKKAFTYEASAEGDCLLNHMPIILGKRLPKEIRDKIAKALEPGGRFLTEYGLATESIQSPLYLENSYWRGPIWGPIPVLIADGLWRSGYREQASEIARRYCDMCLKRGLFAENFDALSGEPLCDPAYTWGSSAYLILAHEFLKG